MPKAQELGERILAYRERLGLSQALGQRLGTFMDDHYRPDPLIVRRGERQASFRQHLGGTKESIQYFSLGRGKADRHMEPLYIEIDPSEQATLTSHEGEEFLIAVSGQLVIHFGKDEHVLAPGDSVYYNSIVPHSVSAGGGVPATAYAVIYQPF